MDPISLPDLDSELKSSEWEEQDRLLCRTDLKYLGRDICGMNDWDECHDRLAEWRYLNRDRRFKMYLMPRGFLKTSILTVAGTIQDILNDFNTRILLSSATRDNAKSFLSEISPYLKESSVLPLMFNNFETTKNPWTQTEITIAQRKVPNKTPTVATAGIDHEVTSQHYKIIRADDLVTRKTVNTAEQIQKTIDHIKDLLKLLDPDGFMDLIGTRWDDSDAYQWILTELTKESLGGDAFVVYNTAPCMDSAGAMVYMSGLKYPPEAIPIFPKKWTIQNLESLRAQLGSYEYSCNLENNPTSPTNRIFQPPMRYWDSLPEEVSHVITVDPAISIRKESADAVVVDTAQSRSGQIFVVEYEAFKGDKKHPARIIDKIIEYLLRFGSNVCGIEAVNYQEVLCTLLADELKKRGLRMEVVPIHQNEDKARRIICLQAPWERGDLLIKRGMPELEEQVEKFRKPIVAKCDILDAIAMRMQVPAELIMFKQEKLKAWAHPRYGQDLPRLKNPYEGKALPEKDWRALQARRGFRS